MNEPRQHVAALRPTKPPPCPLAHPFIALCYGPWPPLAKKGILVELNEFGEGGDCAGVTYKGNSAWLCMRGIGGACACGRLGGLVQSGVPVCREGHVERGWWAFAVAGLGSPQRALCGSHHCNRAKTHGRAPILACALPQRMGSNGSKRAFSKPRCDDHFCRPAASPAQLLPFATFDMIGAMSTDTKCGSRLCTDRNANVCGREGRGYRPLHMMTPRAGERGGGWRRGADARILGQCRHTCIDIL